MNTADCHVLTLPQDNPQWLEELRTDLAAEPLNVHWLQGLPGQFARARCRGYRRGTAPYVTFADPDDRIVPGVVGKLLSLLDEQPQVPFAWAGEQRVDESLKPQGQPNIWPQGYNARRHAATPLHVHGVVLYRRALLEPILHKAHFAGLYGDWAISQIVCAQARASGWGEPVHLPEVGRLWRKHAGNYSRSASREDRARVAAVVRQFEDDLQGGTSA